MKSFLGQIKTELKRLGTMSSSHKYHGPDEQNPSGQGWTIDQSFEIRFKRRTYGVRLCQVSSSRPLQVFVARIEESEGTQNNYHVSFSSGHSDEYGILHVEPSLIRCVRSTRV